MAATFLLAGNGPYLNRGCEAIVRGTVEILRQAFGANCHFINAYWSNSPETDNQEETDTCIETKTIWQPFSQRLSTQALEFIQRLRPYRIINPLTWRLQCRLMGDVWHSHLIRHVNRSLAVLSLGGDNYSLDYGGIQRYIGLDLFARSRKRPIIIWGASIGPFWPAGSQIERQIHRHLRDEVDAIFVREPVSENYLASHGIVNNVYKMADPAFIMRPSPVSLGRLGLELPEGAIALNLSPLMARWSCNGDLTAWKALSVDITHAVAKKFNRPVLLVPHVTIPGLFSNDYDLLTFIYQRLTQKGQLVYLLPSTLNAAETKWVISRCDCLIAARTHATIAGFSTAVPTVSLAYSIKAYGINQSLFGHTDYVVDALAISPRAVVAAVGQVLLNASLIKTQLATRQKDNVKLALRAGQVLRHIVLHC